MTDINVFLEQEFDPKAWVNGICSQRQSAGASDNIDKSLAEMEMRLQLAAEEIEAGLHESSTQALRRIPFAVQEIYRLQGDIQGMQDQVKLLVGHASQDAAEAAASVSNIRQLDAVKKNMESAYSTLKEATDLSSMFIKVEDVFASNDLPRVAQLLRSMRASLALVGDVPEFRAGRGKLRALEDRLQSQVEGALATALVAPASSSSEVAEGSVEAEQEASTRALCDLLLAVDRYSTIERLYVDARLARVHALWEELSAPQGGGPAAIPQWLPVFHARLLPMLKAEVAWAGRMLPSHRASVTAALLKAVFEKISRAVITRMSDRGVPISSLVPLSLEISSFAKGVAEILPAELAADQRCDLLALVLDPLEDAVSRYPSLEGALLEKEVQATLPADPKDGGSMEGDVLVRKLWETIRHAATSCCAAIERCVLLSGGTELPALATVLDDMLTTLLLRVTGCTSQAAARASSSAASHALRGTHGMDESSEEVGTALRLVVLAGEAAGPTLLRKVDTALRAALSTALPRLEAAAAAAASGSSGAGGAPTTPTASQQHTTLQSVGARAGSARSAAGPQASMDPVAMRLARNPDRLQQIHRLAGSLADPRYNPLSQASQQAETLTRSTQSSALDVLLARVRAALQPLPSMAQWTQRHTSAGGTALPSFSVDPLGYVTALGDHLMMLPQQFEVLLGDELLTTTMTQDEQDDMAAQWLDKVVAGAATAYADAIMRITELSPQGGVQLAADVEYFCNVMSALHVAPPPSLLTVQLFAALPDADFPAAAKAAVVDGGADVATLRALATVRHLQAALA